MAMTAGPCGNFNPTVIAIYFNITLICLFRCFFAALCSFSTTLPPISLSS